MFVIIVVSVLVLMSIFIKVCSVHTPSSNPNKPAALKISETLRRKVRVFPFMVYLVKKN